MKRSVVALLLVAAFASTADSVPPRRVPAISLPTRPLGLPVLPGAQNVVRGDDGKSLAWAEGRLDKVDRVSPEAVWRLLDRMGPQLGLESPRQELSLGSIERDELGMHHALFHRVHGGLPVVESDLVLHFAPDGTLVVVNGRYPASLRLAPLALTVDEGRLVTQAIDAAKLSARRRGETTTESPARPPRTRTVIWPEPARRALEVEVSFAPHQRWTVYVDLLRGTPLAVRDLVRTDAPRTGSGLDSAGSSRSLNLTFFEAQQLYGTLDMTNGTTGGQLATVNANYQQSFDAGLFASSTSTFSDRAAVDVHANMRIVYDYFRTNHNRTSWDGQGADVIAVAHFGRGYANAFWNGEVMAFGDGDGQTLVRPHYCLDIAAHELTHAVIERTVGLVYENQSGALNEHFADVFGALVDTDDWTMGEHCVGSQVGNFLRSMSNPNAGGQPKHMNEYQNLPNSEEGDNGGVHINSGIPNRAAYLFAAQAGRQTLGKIWYRILAQRYLSQRSQFLDLRRAAVRACTELSLGAACTQLGSAFDQVGLVEASGGGSGCPANSHPENGYCACNDGYQPNAAGTACEAIPSVSCPPNSHQVGDACYCNDGYVVNAEGTACEPERSGACPPNSHREGSSCVCDDGYQGSPSSDYGCTPVPVSCPPNARQGDPSTNPLEDPARCYCLDGWVVNADQSGCMPGASGCGGETYFGRCQGDELIYCNDARIEVIDCASGGLVCALENTQVGNNCVAKADGCGVLTYEGECAGTVARWCENDAVREIECGARGCFWIDAETGYSCNPCPENAAIADGPQGRRCYCLAGYEPTSDGRCLRASTETPDAGTPTETPDAGTPDAGTPIETPDAGTPTETPDAGLPTETPDAGTPDEGSGGGGGRTTRGPGCSTGGAPDASLFLLLPLALGWVRRRARALLALVLVTGACTGSGTARVPDELEEETRPIVEAPPAPQPALAKAPPPSEAVPADALTLSKGDGWTSEDGTFRLVVKDVLETSSPCPEGAKCVWAGVPRQAVLEATFANETAEWRLREGAVQVSGPWRVEVVKVEPPSVTLTARRVVLQAP